MAEGDDGETAGADTATVFVSYASLDAAVAYVIVETLERHSVRCWIAPRDVTPGAFYADAIVDAINSARVLIVLLSVNSVGSQHVLREVERASAKKRPVLAFRLDATPLPTGLEYFLSASQWLDATTSGVDSTLPKLLEAVRRLVATVPTAMPAHRERPTKPAATPSSEAPAGTPVRQRVIRTVIALSAVIALGLSYVVVDKFWLSKRADRPVAAGVPPAAPVAAAIFDKSVAVLPFADMSEKKDQEYFSDGMAEEIINLLVKIPELRVPARTSSFYFKGKSEDIPTIARRLMVAHVLEGSVRRVGNHLRVTAQLVRADNGYHLWSETYDRRMDDVFKVQDDIAGAVVKALKVSLLEGKTPRATPTTNIEAYTLYLQARSIALSAGQDDYESAIGLLRQSLKMDPKFAAAWAELANDIIDEFGWNKSISAQDARAEAHKAAAEAVELSPNLSDGHLAMAKILYWIDWNWDAAEVEFQRTLAFDPSNADALRGKSYLAETLHRNDQAQQFAQSAVARDPLNSWNYYALAIAQRVGGKLAESAVSNRKALELNPTGAGLHSYLGITLLTNGEPAAALAEIDRETNDLFRETLRPIALDALGRKSEADLGIAIAEKKYAEKAPSMISDIYSCRDDLDQALVWRDRAYRVRDAALLWPVICRTTLSSDPRYKAFLRKMNLPE